MLRYRKWVLTLGIMAVSPGIVTAGPFSFLKRKPRQQTSARQTAKSGRSNQRVAEDIAAALRAARLHGHDIDIEFRNGVAKLTGTVTDVRQKAKATAIVSKVGGVRHVDNQMAIAKRQAAARKRRAVGRKAGQIQQVALQHVQRPAPLAGNAAKPAPRPAARKTNQQTAGEIAQAVSKSGLRGYDIEIRYRGGRALLSGAVGTPEQRLRAAQAAQSVAGVKFVDNRLQVADPSGSQAVQNAAVQFPHRERSAIRPAGYQPVPGQAAPAAAMPPAGFGHPGPGSAQTIYNMPNLPQYAWPATASYPNSAQVSYPKQYSASAWPYIGPFYPYPQVPLGWRRVSLEWKDGMWQLDFNSRTEKWWWFVNPKNW